MNAPSNIPAGHANRVTSMMDRIDSMLDKYDRDPQPLKRVGLTAEKVRVLAGAMQQKILQEQARQVQKMRRSRQRVEDRDLDDFVLLQIERRGRVRAKELAEMARVGYRRIGDSVVRLRQENYPIKIERVPANGTYSPTYYSWKAKS